MVGWAGRDRRAWTNTTSMMITIERSRLHFDRVFEPGDELLARGAIFDYDERLGNFSLKGPEDNPLTTC